MRTSIIMRLDAVDYLTGKVGRAKRDVRVSAHKNNFRTRNLAQPLGVGVRREIVAVGATMLLSFRLLLEGRFAVYAIEQATLERAPGLRVFVHIG